MMKGLWLHERFGGLIPTYEDVTARRAGREVTVDVGHSLALSNVDAVTSAVTQYDFIVLPLSLDNYVAIALAEAAHRVRSPARLILISGTTLRRRDALTVLFDAFFPEPPPPEEFVASLLNPRGRGPDQRALEDAIAVVCQASCFSYRRLHRGGSIEEYRSLWPFGGAAPATSTSVEACLSHHRIEVAGRTLLIDYSPSELSSLPASEASRVVERFLRRDIGDLRRANLQRLTLSDADLRRASLEWAQLEDVQLSRTNLDGANLNKANLDHAQLVEVSARAATIGDANLECVVLHLVDAVGANFCMSKMRALVAQGGAYNFALAEDADLSMATFMNGNLSGVSFNGSDLTGARFFRCDLTNADFRNSVCRNATFKECTLTGIRVHDWTPTGVQFDGGTIEHAFLGPDGEKGAPTAFGSVADFAKLFAALKKEEASRIDKLLKDTSVVVFMSYTRADRLSVLAVDQWLRDRGVRVILDERDFTPGNDIEDEIVRHLRVSTKVVAFYSRASSARPWTKLERRITATLEREAEEHSSAARRLLHFRLDDTPLPTEEAHRLAINAFQMSFADACAVLLRAIFEDAGAPGKVDLSQFEEVPPWKQP